MFIYVFISAYLIILTLKYDMSKGHDLAVLKNNYYANKYYNIVGLILILVAGLSYKIGIDTSRYMIRFDSYPTISQYNLSYIREEQFEPLWMILNIFIKTLFGEFVYLKLLIAIVFNLAILKVIKDFAKYLFLYYYFFLHLYGKLQISNSFDSH